MFKSKWFSVLLVFAVGWLSLSVVKIKLQENIVNDEVGKLEREVSELEKSNSLLQRFITYMDNPVFLEKEARIKLNYKAPDEEVVVVYPDEGKKVISDDTENEPNYVKWWKYLTE